MTDTPVHSTDVVRLEVIDARRSAALIAAVAAATAFVLVRLLVELDGQGPLAVDVRWNDLMVELESAPGIAVARVPAVVGGTIGAVVLGLVLIALLWWRRGRWDAANLAAAMIAVVAIGAPMASVIGRARPQDSLAETVATSFPSGHTAVAATMAVTVGLLVRRWYVWTAGAGWVVLMMWSRTSLHAHWLSDVVAGLLEGVAVACLVWCVVEALRDRRAARAGHPDPQIAVFVKAPPPEIDPR